MFYFLPMNIFKIALVLKEKHRENCMKYWNGLSFRKKTILSLGALFIVVFSSLAFSVIAARNIASQYEDAIGHELTIRDELREINVEMLMARRHEKDFLLRGSEKYLKRHSETITKIEELIKLVQKHGASHIDEKSINQMSLNLKNYETGFKKVIESLKKEGDSSEGIRGELRGTAHKIEELINGNKLGAVLISELLMLRRHEKDFLLRRTDKYHDKVNKRLERIKKTGREFTSDDGILSQLDELCETYKAQFNDLVSNDRYRTDTINSFRSDIHSIEKIIKDSIANVNVFIDKLIKEMDKEKDKLILIMAIAAGLGILIMISVILFYFKVSNIITTITENLKGTSKETANNSVGLQNTANSLSSSVQEQAAAILETVSTLDEIREMMKRSVDNAKFSEDKASESHNIANTGKTAVSNVVTAINDISNCNNDITKQMEKTSTELTQIVNVIREISEKTKVINDIVFQTKLLSFNASVESARAGEHGKGFAVVAEEVGNLATMSGKASSEIEELISSSVQRVETIVAESKEAVEKLVKVAADKTEYGVKAVQECDSVLDEVVANVANVKDLMKEISQAASEQATGVENISEAMNELDQATHMNTNLANHTANNSNDMAKQAENLDGIVTSLEDIVKGSHLKNAVKVERKLFEKASSKGLETKADTSNVVEFSAKKTEEKVEHIAEADFSNSEQPTAGGEIPSRDDDRFEDV